MQYYLYILKSEIEETYYIGFSDHPERRCYFHNNDSKGYTVRFRPWKLVYREAFTNEKRALEAERKGKSWKSKKMVRYLVEGVIDIHDYL